MNPMTVLLAECHTLEKMLANPPKGHFNAFIHRTSLQARLENVREEIEQLKKIPQPSIHGKISFRGRAVVGCHGIDAAFSAEAIQLFEKIVATKAASYSTTLSTLGKLPNRDQYHLIITGTTRGSFGFELENSVHPDELPNIQEASSYFEDALNETIDLFNSINSTDEKLAEILLETDNRIIKEVTDFLKLLADSESVCSLEFGSRSFYFNDVAEIKNGYSRLQKDNIIENDEKILGQFIGVLPHKRMFEFLTEPDETILSGKISNNIDDPASINFMLNTPVNIEVHTTKVGNSKPKYLLTSCEKKQFTDR